MKKTNWMAGLALMTLAGCGYFSKETVSKVPARTDGPSAPEAW